MDSTTSDSSRYVVENKYQTQSAWAILTRKKGICMSLAATYQILCMRLGLQVVTIINSTHAWNKVKIGDKWYVVDITFDEGLTTDNAISSLYLFKTDDEVENIDKKGYNYGDHDYESFWLKYKL